MVVLYGSLYVIASLIILLIMTRYAIGVYGHSTPGKKTYLKAFAPFYTSLLLEVLGFYFLFIK